MSPSIGRGIDRLDHVVQREPRDRDGGQGLHLDAGAARSPTTVASMRIDVALEAEVDRDGVERQDVRERDQLARALRPRDAGDPRGGQHVGLRQAVGPDERDHLGAWCRADPRRARRGG